MIPGGLAPEIGNGPERRIAEKDERQLSGERQQRRREPRPDPTAQLALAHAFGPGRQHRHHDVEPEQHGDEPKVSAGIWEVEEHPYERRIVDERIVDAPEGERQSDAHEPPAEELAGRTPDREQEIGRRHDEQRHAAAADHLEHRNPDRVGGTGDLTSSVPSNVIRLGAMNHNDHQTGRDPQIVQKHLPSGRFAIHLTHRTLLLAPSTLSDNPDSGCASAQAFCAARRPSMNAFSAARLRSISALRTRQASFV